MSVTYLKLGQFQCYPSIEDNPDIFPWEIEKISTCNHQVDFPQLEELHNINSIQFHNNCINSLAYLRNFHNLQFISLNHNSISFMDHLSHLKMLNTLKIENNQITKISGLKVLNNLEKLSLKNNKIAKIENLDCINLKYLNLGSNRIDKIENLNHLIYLNTLFLSFNNISKLEKLSQLNSLKSLHINHNKISHLETQSISKNLEILNISYNNFEQIDSFKYLKLLKKVECNINHELLLKISENISLKEIVSDTEQDIAPLLIERNNKLSFVRNMNEALKISNFQTELINNSSEQLLFTNYKINNLEIGDFKDFSILTNQIKIWLAKGSKISDQVIFIIFDQLDGYTIGKNESKQQLASHIDKINAQQQYPTIEVFNHYIKSQQIVE